MVCYICKIEELYLVVSRCKPSAFASIFCYNLVATEALCALWAVGYCEWLEWSRCNFDRRNWTSSQRCTLTTGCAKSWAKSGPMSTHAKFFMKHDFKRAFCLLPQLVGTSPSILSLRTDETRRVHFGSTKGSFIHAASSKLVKNPTLLFWSMLINAFHNFHSILGWCLGRCSSMPWDEGRGLKQVVSGNLGPVFVPEQQRPQTATNHVSVMFMCNEEFIGQPNSWEKKEEKKGDKPRNPSPEPHLVFPHFSEVPCVFGMLDLTSVRRASKNATKNWKMRLDRHHTWFTMQTQHVWFHVVSPKEV